MYIYKVGSSGYSYVTFKELPFRITGNNGVFQDGSDGKVYDLPDLSDGAYRLQFEAEDAAGKKSESDYYYIYLDTTNETVEQPESSSATTNSITFNGISGASSSTYYFYKMKKADEDIYGTPVKLSSTSETITGLNAGTSYNFNFFKCDEFGNMNNVTEFTKNTKPATPAAVSMVIPAASQNKITVNWKKGTNPNYKGVEIIRTKHSPESGNINTPIEQSSVIVEALENQDEYSMDFTDLMPGFRYSFKVRSYDAGDSFSSGYYNYSDYQLAKEGSAESIVLPPEPATNLTVKDNYNGSVILNWKKPAAGFANAYYYSYKLASDPAAEWSSPELYYDANSTYPSKTISLPDSMTGKAYIFRIEAAVNNSSTYAVNYNKSLSAPECTFFIPPKNLVNFTVASTTNTSITLNWTNPSTTYDGIKIGYKKKGDSSYTYKDIAKTATSYTISGLSNSTQYDICYNTYTNNANSVVKCQERSVSRITRPNAVTGFTAAPVSGSQIKLSWTKPEGAYTGIYLYKKASSESDFSLLTTITNNTATEYTWNLSDADSGNVYNVKAIAYYNTTDNTSAENTPIKANTSVDAVTGLKVTATEKNSITLNWTNPTTAYDSLAITYTKAGGNTVAGPVVEKTASSVTIPSLETGCNYTINVTAKSTKNGKNYTKNNNVSQYTRPNAVSDVTITRNSSAPGTSFDVSWTPSSSGTTSGAFIFYSTNTSFSSASYVTYTTGTSAKITGLTAGTKYNVWVVPYAGTKPSGTSASSISSEKNTTVPSSGVSYYTKPNAISGQKVTATTTGSATLSWTAPAGNRSGYRIYVKDGSGSLIYNTTVTSTSTTISSLTAGHSYTFDIRAYAGDTDSNANESASVTVSQAIRPNAVSGVTVNRNSSEPETKLDVSWSTSSSGSTTGVMVFYSTGTTAFSGATHATSTTNKTATITVPTAGTKYNVWVVPYAGTVPTASTVTGGSSLNTGADTSSACYTKPNAISGQKVTATTTGSATLSWTASAGNRSGYRIYVKDGSGSLTYNTTVTSTSTTISSLTAGHSYTFDIRAYAGDTDSNANESASVTVSQAIRPNAVSGVTVKRNTSYPGTQLDISWSTSSTGTTNGAMVFYSTDTTFSSAKYLKSVTGTSTQITGLTAGTKYNVWVVSYAGTVATASTVTGGTSLNTGAVTSSSCYTRPNAPTGVTINARNNTSIKISWTKPSAGNLTGYNISKRDITAGESSFTNYSNTTSTSTTVSSLKIGHQYEFKVTSYAGDTGNENGTATNKAYTTIPACSFTVSRNSSNPNTKQTLDWTYPATQNDLFITIYRGTSSSFTNASYLDYWNSSSNSSKTTQTFESLTPNTQYYYWIVTSIGSLSGKTTSQVNNLSSDVRTISSYENKYTAPNAPTGLGYNYDDGMGRLKLTWTNPSSYSSIKAKVDTTVFTVSSSNSWIDIPSYSRSSSYTIYLYAYSADNTESLPVSKTYSNASGNLMINGTTYSYTGFTNVNSTSRSIAKSSDGWYRWQTSGKYETHHSVFSNNSSNYSNSSSAGSGSSVSIPVYSMCKYEVNQKLYKAVMGTNPSKEITGDDYPVDTVSWNDAVLFCNKLSTIFELTPVYDAKLTSNGSYVTNWTVGSNPYSVSYNSSSSNGFRLPTKVQWEFAARGGDPSNTTHWRSYYAGSQSTYNDKTYRQRVAWDDDPGTPHYVNSVRNSSYPHLLGICNMSGNVWEWIYEYDGSNVLAMGGSWDNDTRCGLDSSYSDARTKQADVVGFRICRNKVVQ